MKPSAPITGYFYSGFLTENGERRVEPIDMASDEWGRSVAAFVGPHANLRRLHWKSVSFGKVMPPVEQMKEHKVGLVGSVLMHNVNNWKGAVAAADAEADALAKWLDDRLDEPQLLMGHSLGARIVLKAAMKSKHQSAHVVAFAPALPVSAFEAESLDSPHRIVEVFYSPTDYVLGVAYPTGQGDSGEVDPFNVLGRVGPPSGIEKFKRIHFYDTNRILEREKFGHTDYMKALPELAKHSRVIRELSGKSNSFLFRILSAPGEWLMDSRGYFA